MLVSTARKPHANPLHPAMSNQEIDPLPFASIPGFSPFSGDPLLLAEVARLIGKWRVAAAVETGTHHGHTTLALSLLCGAVATFETHAARADVAESLFRRTGRDNIRLFRLSSETGIAALAEELGAGRILYYLDAHWNDYWPLLDELIAISKVSGPKPVIVIHDFQVPGRPELGHDSYKGVDLNLDYVHRALEGVYRGRFSIHFNSEALGKRRGVLFAEPEE